MASSRSSSGFYAPPVARDFVHSGLSLLGTLPDYAKLLSDAQQSAMRGVAAYRAAEVEPELRDREKRLANARIQLLEAQASGYPAIEKLKLAQAQQALDHGEFYRSRISDADAAAKAVGNFAGWGQGNAVQPDLPPTRPAIPTNELPYGGYIPNTFADPL